MAIRWKQRVAFWAVAMVGLGVGGQYVRAESPDPVISLTTETPTPSPAATPTPGTQEKPKKSDMYPHKVKPFKVDVRQGVQSQSEPIDPDICRAMNAADGAPTADENGCTHTVTSTFTLTDNPGPAPPKPAEATQPAQQPSPSTGEKGKFRPTAASSLNILGINESLEGNQAIYSGGGDLSLQYMLIMQSDGNLVYYSPRSAVAGRMPLWSTGTAGSCANCIVYMQNDGNLVLYSRVAIPSLSVWGGTTWSWQLFFRWQTRTAVPYGARLFAQADGNLVMYNGVMGPVWQTGTNHSGPYRVQWEAKLCNQSATGPPCGALDERVSAVMWYDWSATWLEGPVNCFTQHLEQPWRMPQVEWCGVGTWSNPNYNNGYTRTMNVGSNGLYCYSNQFDQSVLQNCTRHYIRLWLDLWGRGRQEVW